MIAWLLSKLFKCEEINGANRCPTYLYRWQLFRRGSVAVYLHRFVGDDWSKDVHDHPKRFLCVGLWGRYFETEMIHAGTYRSRSGYDEFRTREFAAPYIRTFPAKHTHRVTVLPGEEKWTLVIVFAATRPWGFWHLGLWMPWREYVKGKFSHIADRMAACASLEDKTNG